MAMEAKVKDVGSFLREVKRIEDQWNKSIRKDNKKPEEDKRTVKFFFRGHRDVAWELMPSLFRDFSEVQEFSTQGVDVYSYYSEEQYLIQEAQRLFPTCFEKCKTDVDRMSVAQHYELPTRLLDVSGNALVALYFAVQKVDGDVDGKVFMFRASAEDYKIASTGGQSVKILIQDFHDTNKQLVIEKPTLLFPTFRTERQRAQDGAFYLFPNRVKPVKVIGIKEELYREILIPGTIKGIVKKELEEICNIHQGVLFPESLSYTSLKLKKEAEERIRSNMCL